jgi:fructose-1,6-bisphosphatase-3
MFLIYNGNLLYHGCIPMNADGSFVTHRLGGRQLWPREYMDTVERLARQGYFATDPALKQQGLDTMWYLWSGPQSPLFGKSKMATFERQFLADRETHREAANSYYAYRDQDETAQRILTAFGLDTGQAHIINGHVPVKVNRGESPVKAGGRLLVIDGGLSKAYQAETGIAGYTLIYNSYGLLLATHEPFESTQKAIEEGADIHSKTTVLETNRRRIRVGDTDYGRQIKTRVAALKALLAAFRAGTIKQRRLG